MSKEPGNKLVTEKDKLPFSNSAIQNWVPKLIPPYISHGTYCELNNLKK